MSACPLVHRNAKANSGKELWFTSQAIQLAAAKSFFIRDIVDKRIVVDLGCGTGYLTAAISESAKLTVGVDISSEEFKSIPHKSGGVDFIVADALFLPFQPQSIEVAIAIEVIEHLPRVHEFLKSVRECLRKEGSFVCSTPDKNQFSGGDEPWLQGHVHEYTSPEFQRLLGEYFPKVTLYGQLRTKSKFGILSRTILTNGAPKRVIVSLLGRRASLMLANAIFSLFSSKNVLQRVSEETLAHTRNFSEEYLVVPIGDDSFLDLVALAQR